MQFVFILYTLGTEQVYSAWLISTLEYVLFSGNIWYNLPECLWVYVNVCMCFVLLLFSLIHLFIWDVWELLTSDKSILGKSSFQSFSYYFPYYFELVGFILG